MLFQNPADSTFSGQIDADLEELLGQSQFFEPQHKLPAETSSRKLNEIDQLLKDKCSLYKITSSESKFSSTIPGLLPIKRSRKKVESATAGPNWFNMPAQELTPELKADLEAVRMRRYINPKIFYKKKDVDQLPKFFQVRVRQIGTVLPSPDEPKSLRVAQDKKRKTLVEQMLMEDEERQFSRRKQAEIEAVAKAKRKRGPRGLKKRRLGMSR